MSSSLGLRWLAYPPLQSVSLLPIPTLESNPMALPCVSSDEIMQITQIKWPNSSSPAFHYGLPFDILDLYMPNRFMLNRSLLKRLMGRFED